MRKLCDTTLCALVTGANKGIGLEIARQLGQAGLRIIIGARDAERGEMAARTLATEGIVARHLQLDLTDPASAQRAAADIGAREGSLNILVNNAGISDPRDASPAQANLDAVRRVFETNFLGTLSVTQAMLPLLQKAHPARIINLSSGLGSLTLNADPSWEYSAYKLIGYNASKAAVNMLTVQLAAELRQSGVRVNAADPGFTATDLNGHRGRQTIPQGPVSGQHFCRKARRSLKYECVYLHAWETGSEAKAGVRKWMDFYNHKRPHSALGGKPPAVVYWQRNETTNPDQQAQRVA